MRSPPIGIKLWLLAQAVCASPVLPSSAWLDDFQLRPLSMPWQQDSESGRSWKSSSHAEEGSTGGWRQGEGGVRAYCADLCRVTRVMSSSCSHPYPVKERSLSIRKPASELSSASCSASSLLSWGTPNISPWGS